MLITLLCSRTRSKPRMHSKIHMICLFDQFSHTSVLTNASTHIHAMIFLFLHVGVDHKLVTLLAEGKQGQYMTTPLDCCRWHAGVFQDRASTGYIHKLNISKCCIMLNWVIVISLNSVVSPHNRPKTKTKTFNFLPHTQNLICSFLENKIAGTLH